MQYLFITSLVASIWLQGAWSEGLVGIWGLIASLGVMFAWVVLIELVAYNFRKEERKNKRDGIHAKRKS